jgi:RNA polymerase sigma-70 factor (ECF subfamily)
MFDENRHWVSSIPVWRSDSPDALMEEKQLQECINKTLELLPPAQKAAFILRELEEQPFETICEMLQVSSANVRVLLHRARLTLMQMIDRYQETGSCC